MTKKLDLATELTLTICKSFVLDEDFSASSIEKMGRVDVEKWNAYIRGHKLVLLANYVLSTQNMVSGVDIINQWQLASRKLVFRDLQLFKETGKIIKLFHKKGIPILPYKGREFSRLFYGSQAIRHSIDSDLSIRLADLRACRGLMLESGFHQVKGDLKNEGLKSSRAYYLDYPWQKELESGMTVLVEFHLSPAHKALFVPLDFDQCLDKPLLDDSGNLIGFSRVEHALFIIIHHGAVDLWGKLLHLVDLNQIVKVLSHEEWDDLILLCEKAKVRHFLDLGLQLNEVLFDVDYSMKFKYAVRPGLLDKIKNDILLSRLNGKWSENKRILWYHLLFRDSITDRLKTIVALSRYMLFRIFGL